MFRAFVLLALIVHATAFAATLHGEVIRSDGRNDLPAYVSVTPLAVVTRADERHPVIDRRFKIELAAPGAYRVEVVAPWQAVTVFPVFVTQATERIQVEITPGAMQVLPGRGVPSVRGEWSDYKAPEAMTAQPDGTFVFRGTSTAPSVRYYIERNTALGPHRQPNPDVKAVEQHEHRMVSRAEVRDGTFEIRFDPRSFTERPLPETAKVRFPRRPDLDGAYEIHARFDAYDEEVEYALQVLEVPRNKPNPELTAKWKVLQSWLEQQVKRGPKLTRQVAAAKLLRQTHDLEKRKRLRALLPVDSLAWAVAPPLEMEGTMLGAVLPKPAADEYAAFAEKLAFAHPDSVVRAVSLMGAASRAKSAGDSQKEARFVQELRRNYSDRDYVRWWFQQRDPRPLSLTAGMPFPETQVTTTSGVRVDRAYFASAPLTVVVFSSIGCGSCRMMLPDLRRVRAAYGEDQLNIVTLHAAMTDALLAHELRAEHQPWDHVALGEETHPLENACDVRGFPTVLLVGSDGKVVNRDDGLWVRIESAVRTTLAAITEKTAAPAERAPAATASSSSATSPATTASPAAAATTASPGPVGAGSAAIPASSTSPASAAPPADAGTK